MQPGVSTYLTTNNINLTRVQQMSVDSFDIFNVDSVTKVSSVN